MGWLESCILTSPGDLLRSSQAPSPGEDEMVGGHYQLNGHEFEQTLGDGEGQGSLVCCSPWAHKESNTTKRRTKTPVSIKCKYSSLWKGSLTSLLFHILK